MIFSWVNNLRKKYHQKKKKNDLLGVAVKYVAVQLLQKKKLAFWLKSFYILIGGGDL